MPGRRIIVARGLRGDRRLVSARMVCAGSGIEFLQADAREEELGRQFDLILCTDVLEHVPGWPRVIERIAEALAPAGAAFVSVNVFPRFVERRTFIPKNALQLDAKIRGVPRESISAE